MRYEKVWEVFMLAGVKMPTNIVLDGYPSVRGVSFQERTEGYDWGEHKCCGVDAYPHPDGVKLVKRCLSKGRCDKSGLSQTFIIFPEEKL